MGQVLKAFASALLDILKQETHLSSPPGYNTSVPTQAADYTRLQDTPIKDDKILSDFAFTEKGEKKDA